MMFKSSLDVAQRDHTSIMTKYAELHSTIRTGKRFCALFELCSRVTVDEMSPEQGAEFTAMVLAMTMIDITRCEREILSPLCSVEEKIDFEQFLQSAALILSHSYSGRSFRVIGALEKQKTVEDAKVIMAELMHDRYVNDMARIAKRISKFVVVF